MLAFTLFYLVTVVSLSGENLRANLLGRTASIQLIFAAILVANAFNWIGLSSNISLYNGLTNISPIAIFAQILFLGVGALALIPWAPLGVKGTTSVARIGSYTIFCLITTIGGCLLVSSGDLITFYLALELQSFSVYVLAALYRDLESATQAGILYFMLGGLSSSIILLGFGFIYHETGLTSLKDFIEFISILVTNLNILDNPGLIIGFTCVAVGIFFKVTAAPFHHWGPDVYNGVPTIVTTWLAVLPKISLVMLILMISTGIIGSLKMITTTGIEYDIWVTLLLVSSLISLVVGTVVGLAQTEIKRLLAYSTVSHIGFMLLSISISTLDGVVSTIVYLFQYTLTALLSFSAVLALGYNDMMKTNQNDPSQNYKTADLITIKSLTGKFQESPAIMACLATALFSMAGVPPLLGFYGKQAVLYASINSGLVFMSIVAVVTSVISASYYLYMVQVAYFDGTSQSVVNNSSLTQPKTETVSFQHSYTLSVITLMTIGFMASPDLLLDICRLMALTHYFN